MLDNPARSEVDTTHPNDCDPLGWCEIGVLALEGGNMTLAYYPFAVSSINRESRASLQGIANPLMIEGKQVLKDVLVEWNQNSLGL